MIVATMDAGFLQWMAASFVFCFGWVLGVMHERRRWERNLWGGPKRRLRWR